MRNTILNFIFSYLLFITSIYVYSFNYKFPCQSIHKKLHHISILYVLRGTITKKSTSPTTPHILLDLIPKHKKENNATSFLPLRFQKLITLDTHLTATLKNKPFVSNHRGRGLYFHLITIENQP